MTDSDMYELFIGDYVKVVYINGNRNKVVTGIVLEETMSKLYIKTKSNLILAIEQNLIKSIERITNGKSK